jgi:AcrR family transcriptional regulator
MPREIDRKQRILDVAGAAADLIVEGGLDAVTFRNLAARLKCSTMAISHYFATRNDVLRATYQFVADRAAARRAQASADIRRNAEEQMKQILPIGREQARDWVVWLCFWTSGLFDPALARMQKKRSDVTRGEIRRLLELIGYPARQSDELAQTLMTTIYGIGIQAIWDPKGWTPERQRREFEKVLHMLGKTASGGATRAKNPAAKR